MPRHVASCCSGQARCSPGRSCRRSRARRAAIRASSPSCCAAGWTGLPPWRRSEIPIGSSCAATTRSGLTVRRRRCRSTASSRSTRPCRTSTGSIGPARPSWCMRLPRPTASAPISTGRTCWKAAIARPGRADSGWLNRALTSLEPDDRVRAGTNRGRAFAVGPITPLVVRGPAPVLSWAPSRLPPVSDDTTMRLLDLYRHTDPTLARVLEDRIDLAMLMPGNAQDRGAGDKGPVGSGRRHQSGAGIFRRGRRSGGAVPGEPRWTACRRARARRLGYA